MPDPSGTYREVMPVPVGLPVTVPVDGTGGAVVIVQDDLIAAYPTTYRLSNFGPLSIVVRTGGGRIMVFRRLQVVQRLTLRQSIHN